VEDDNDIVTLYYFVCILYSRRILRIPTRSDSGDIFVMSITRRDSEKWE